MQPQRYFLTGHTRACMAGEHLVFMDLRHDQYFSLSRNASRLVAALLDDGATLARESTVAARESALAADALVMLLEQGLISASRPAGHCARRAEPSRAASELRPVLRREMGRIPSRQWLRYARAAASAALRLRFRPVARTIAAARTRRADAVHTVSLDRVHELMSIVLTLRPLVPKASNCLFESLSTLEFLAANGVAASWVFGVKTSPFGAHCWLQAGEAVINDSLEDVRAFTPILCV